MIRIIKEASVQHHVEYSLNYDTSRSGGYSFPCDHEGKLLPLHPSAQANYEMCKSGEVQTIRPPYVREHTYTEHTYAVGECYCGAPVELQPDGEGLCYCHCGSCYNAAGQSIRPRSEWEEPYDY